MYELKEPLCVLCCTVRVSHADYGNGNAIPIPARIGVNKIAVLFGAVVLRLHARTGRMNPTDG